MNTSKFKALLAALMLAFTISMAFSGCSSSEEAPPPDTGGGGECPGGGPRGDDGICCDADMMQPGCPLTE